MQVEVNVDGETLRREVDPRLLLVDLLRGRGPRIGCDTSHCGACAVLLDGRPVKSCTILAMQARGKQIHTVPSDASPSAALQDGFTSGNVRGCGFCLSGMMAALAPLSSADEADTMRRAISGNLCRCTGYGSLVRAAMGRHGNRTEQYPGRSFIGDALPEGATHLAILRSPLAHAAVRSIDVSRALELPGVVVAITAADLGEAAFATEAGEPRPVLAANRVVFQGQEVAAVVAEDPYAAQDALESITVDYDPLPATIRSSGAAEVWYRWSGGESDATDRAMGKADEVVEIDMIFPRLHGAPLETNACVAVFDGDRLVVQATTEHPDQTQDTLAEMLGEPLEVVVPVLGGGFGTKTITYPGYVLAAWAARRLGRPVAWQEPRSEHQASTAFAGDVAMRGKLALTRTGHMLALRVEAVCDHGAYVIGMDPPERAWLPITGPYRIGAVDLAIIGVRTNTAPGGGGGRTLHRSAEGCLLLERLLDVAATRLGLDSAEIRRRNLLTPDNHESRSPLGLIHDPRGYSRTFEVALSRVGYEHLRAEQASPDSTLGIGIACFVGGEMTPPSFGTCAATIDVDLATGRWQVRRMVVALSGGVDGSPAAVDWLDGDVVAGFGAAALEGIDYDEDGNCLGSTFLDYLVPGALEAPPVEVVSTGGPLNLDLARGLAAVGPPAALANAVADALARRGAPPVGLPMTAARVWEAIHGSAGA